MGWPVQENGERARCSNEHFRRWMQRAIIRSTVGADLFSFVLPCPFSTPLYRANEHHIRSNGGCSQTIIWGLRRRASRAAERILWQHA